MDKDYTNFNGYFDTESLLKIKFTPSKIITQNSSNAMDSGIKATPISDGSMIFLVPNTFQEDIIHTWGNYDSLGTRAVKKEGQLIKVTSDTTNQIKALTNSAITGAKTAWTTGSLTKALSTGHTGNVVTKKVDTPTTFQDSQRRSLSLTLILSDIGNTEKNVFEPVRLLQKYSCAEKDITRFGFNMPYIFTVETIDSPLIYIEYSALTSVQPTYYGPYRDGFPSKCELTLKFDDLQPLYRRSFEKRGNS